MGYDLFEVIMKICVIKQPAGLGDIFFTQKIAHDVLTGKKADLVIWPVIKEYSYLSDYLIGDKIFFVNEEEFFPFKNVYASETKDQISLRGELIYIPLQSADSLIKDVPVMQAKYKFYGLDYSDWKNFFNFKRNYERENKLIDYLGININEPFNLINRKFGSKNYAHLNNNIPIQVNNGFKNIEMEYLDFDNVFDWIGLMEKAVEIHTVDTVWCYLLAKLGNKNVTVYSRTKNQFFFSYVNGIFDSDWKFIL